MTAYTLRQARELVRPYVGELFAYSPTGPAGVLELDDPVLVAVAVHELSRGEDRLEPDPLADIRDVDPDVDY